MSRQKKQTVDYFPHQCNHSSTIFVLEQKYKNDGYSFWFKLLELLATTESHYYDYSNPAKWEFLQAKTGLTSDLCSEILNTLVNLEAIDKEAWENKGIWCQNFVDGIADVYRKRTVEIPLRPSFGQRKPRTVGNRIAETRKVNESKLNESKLNKTKSSKDIYIIEFEQFWKQYPKKVGKDKALESWKKKKPNLEQCLKTLSWQKESDQWNKDKGQFIPMPTTWINQGRWNDEQPIVDNRGDFSKPIKGKYSGTAEVF